MLMKLFRKAGRSFKRRVLYRGTCWAFRKQDSIAFEKERSKPLAVNVQTNVGLGNHDISAQSKDQHGQPASGVLVRLKQLVRQDNSRYTWPIRK